MKIISVVGARPQFVKYAPLGHKLKSEFDEICIHSGQHYDENLSKIFFRQMDIPEPDINLNIGSHTHGKQTALIMIGLEEQFIKIKPDLVIVFGDTNTTLAGALVASKLKIKIAHVEAGLRSRNRDMPEEINRILTDQCSDLLFCPTESAVNNLRVENIKNAIFNTGDLMFDVFKKYASKDETDVLKKLSLKPNHYYLCTIHRAENTDSPENMKRIFKALNDLDQPVLLPLHPRTLKVIKKLNVKIGAKINIIDPLGYQDMVQLLLNCKKVITDSGGLQKEAFFAKKYCKTLREETEWTETLKENKNVICGSNIEKIVTECLKEENTFVETNFPFGDGNSSDAIVEILRKNI